MSLFNLQPPTVAEQDISSDQVLVCGLGSLGQFCVLLLREFGVPVRAVTLKEPLSWEFSNFPDLVEPLMFGDCRQPDVLQKIGVETCRAVLLVTSDERVNIEAAFAIRLLNPTTQLVVRSAKENLNALVGDRLGNFVAFEATQLPAPAFAIAALSSEIRGFITLDNALLRVVKDSITRDHCWCDRRALHTLNTQTRRILSYISYGTPLPTKFYQWHPDTIVQAGAQIAYIEISDALALQPVPAIAPSLPHTRNLWQQVQQNLMPSTWKKRWSTLWRSTIQQQTRRVAIFVGSGILTLLVLGTLILKLSQPNISLLQAFYLAAVMLLGAYDAVYGILNPQDTIPLWMRFMNLTYMLAGTASIAVLYALLTETLLAAKFQLPRKRPPMPTEGHVVLVGLGRVGRRVASFLQHIKQPIGSVSNTALEPTVLPQLPVVVGDLATRRNQVNLATAKSVVLATDDEMLNLELGLMAHSLNPRCRLVIRTL